MKIDPKAPYVSTWLRDGKRVWQTFRGSLPICPETDRETALRFHRGMTEPWLPYDAKIGAYAPATVWDGEASAFRPYSEIEQESPVSRV